MKITFIRNLCFFTPHFIIFMGLLYFSMGSANDRQPYLYFFDDPYMDTRYEYLFTLLAKFFHAAGFNNVFSIMMMQSVTFFLYCFVWNKLSITQNLISLSFFSIILFTVFSSVLGVQIRFGFSISILLFFYVLLREKNILYKILYIIPAFIHFGTIPFLIFATVSDIKQSCSKTKLVLLITIGSLAMMVITSNILYLLSLPSFLPGYYPSYYSLYFDGTFKNANATSLTVMYYYFILLINFSFEGKKVPWLPYSGFIFAIIALVSGFDLLLKFLTPFILLATIDLFNHLHRVKLITKVQTPFWYFFSFFSFFYFFRTVGLY